MKSTRGVSPPRGRASRARTARRRRLCLGEAARHLHALEDEIQASATEILVPALAFTRNAVGQPLHSSRAGSLQLRSRRLHRGLVLSEIALSIVPLIAAGLMLRTFANLLETPIGFDPAHVVTARVSLNLGVFSTVDRRSMFYRDAIARVRELPGVEGASLGGPPPLAPVQSTLRFRRSDDGDGTIGMHRSVMPGYLGVMGIPMRAGRDISDDDIIHGRRVTIIDERLAAQLWQGDAIGKRLSVEYSKQPLEVVGVAGHIRAQDIRDSGTLMIYVPSHVYEIEQTLVVKTRAPLYRRNRARDQTGGRGARPRQTRVRHPTDGRHRPGVDRRYAIHHGGAVGVRRCLAGARGDRAVRHARLSHLPTHAGVRRAARVGRIGWQHSPARVPRGLFAHRPGRGDQEWP